MGKTIFDKAGDLLNNAIGEDGVKTDIKVSFDDQSLYKSSLALFVPLFLLIIVYFLVKSITDCKKS